MWVPGWMLMGCAAFVLVVVNLLRAALGKHRGWQGLLIASLSGGGQMDLRRGGGRMDGL